MKIAMLGDIALIGKWSVETKQWKDKLSELRKLLAEYDYVIANLESPLTDQTKSFVAKSMHLRSKRENVKILQYLGVSAVSLANNHILDFGARGLRETIETLEQVNIAWYGINGKCLHVKHGQESVCISGFCCYSTNLITKIGSYRVNLLSPKNVLRQLEADKLNREYSIVSLHWGIEHVHCPSMDHRKLVQTMMQYKACSIHGHHPHVLQGIWENENGIAAYSLGNCLFDDAVSLNRKIVVRQLKENKESILAGIEIKDQKMKDFWRIGLREYSAGIMRDEEVEKNIDMYSQLLKHTDDPEEYERLRNRDFEKSIKQKFQKGGKLKWMVSRMSYYSIGAKLLRIKNKIRYQSFFH